MTWEILFCCLALCNNQTKTAMSAWQTYKSAIPFNLNCHGNKKTKQNNPHPTKNTLVYIK